MLFMCVSDQCSSDALHKLAYMCLYVSSSVSFTYYSLPVLILQLLPKFS
jgi:hypothetical protein